MDTDATAPDTGLVPAVDAGDTPEEALALEDAALMRIDPPGDRDFYWFVAEAGVTYEVSVRTAPDIGAFDPVLRAYDAAGAMFAENDTLPYALRGPAPALLVRRVEGGRVLLEVLDRADWLGGTGFGAGNARYDLVVRTMDRVEPNEDTHADNDTLEQSLENAEAGHFDWYLDPWAAELHFVAGDAVAPGDVDVLSIEVAARDVPGVWQVSAVPGLASPYRMRLSLLDSSGQEVAQTEDPQLGDPLGSLFDAGISYPITEPGRYYVRVQDTSGVSGPGAWYALIGRLSPFGHAVEHDLPVPEVGNEAVVLPLSRDQGAQPPSSSASWFGRIEDFSGTPDPFDTFIVEPANGAVAGALLTVQVETASAGSTLDARLVVTYDDGAEIAASDADPSGQYADEPGVFDVPLTRDGPIRITVEPQNGASGESAFYLGTARLVSPP